MLDGLELLHYAGEDDKMIKVPWASLVDICFFLVFFYRAVSFHLSSFIYFLDVLELLHYTREDNKQMRVPWGSRRASMLFSLSMKASIREAAGESNDKKKGKWQGN